MEWLRSNLVKIHAILPQLPQPTKKITPLSVNYFPHRKCNYACEFCFHTDTSMKVLQIDEAKKGLRLLAEAGMKKLNISGGEPFLAPDFIGEIFRYCKEDLQIESCSVVNNGSKVTEKWLDKYGCYLDYMAISCDSFDPGTSEKLGRAEKGRTSGNHIARVFDVADWCRSRGIKVKINSVITALNWEEDMNDQIEQLAPSRWKVFQVLLLDGENTGKENDSLRDARKLTITEEQFKAFLRRHEGQQSLVPEDNEAMKNSYLNLDEEMRFLNCTTNAKIPTQSILKVGVSVALEEAGFDEESFVKRGGVFNWSRDTAGTLSKDGLEW